MRHHITFKQFLIARRQDFGTKFVMLFCLKLCHSQVNIFFDGVSARINAGVKEAEISYQLQFSKQELKKVVHAYPGREVRAGLEKLYKKVEKHLSEEENLLQVVWHHMQEEFIRQYKYIEDLLQRCYPGAQICLDFTMEDILEYFSGIAMHH